MTRQFTVLGLDPGLRRTGWGLIRVEGTRLTHIAHGVVKPSEIGSLASRLAALHAGLTEVLESHRPDHAAVEETFVNKDPVATLKLGQARAISLLVPALAGLDVAEYAPNHVKKAVVGVGHATKDQVHAMVRRLLAAADIGKGDAADALAVAICHAHHAGTSARLKMVIGQTNGQRIGQ